MSNFIFSADGHIAEPSNLFVEGLPPSLREEARRRAPEGSLTDETRCLCLVATRGTEPDWNDVERSAAHRVLPLSDAALAVYSGERLRRSPLGKSSAPPE